MIPEDIIFGPLNAPQREVVEAINGPTLVLAGAGSGKTRALTHRIAFLINQGVQPWQILSVTFTNKAAGEMKERIRKLLQMTEGQDLSSWSFGSGRLPAMGTFHSICVRILRRDIERIGRERSFVIYDSDDQLRLMKHTLEEMKMPEETLKPKAALAGIGRFKCEALTPAKVRADATSDHTKALAEAYYHYEANLKKANALDFDDLILETLRLFVECPDVLDRYQETWKYIHVDEYQDTNHSQYVLITLLAQKYENLCVIGDPDQSIYMFRGADVRNILDFNKQYPSARCIKLEQNYRSTQLILDGADAVIAQNPNRPEKRMWSERKTGPLILVQEVADERAEGGEAVRRALSLKNAGTRFNDQVILYRTNAQSRLFEEACLRSGIPYRIVGGTKFYARQEIKDVMAYLRVIVNPSDTVSLLRIINVPARKIGGTTMEKLQAHSQSHGLSLWDTLNEAHKVAGLNGPTAQRLTEFTDLIRSLQEQSRTLVVADVMNVLIGRIKLDEWLKDGTEEGEERWHNVQELYSVMHKYDALEPQLSLTSFLEEVALVSEVDNLAEGTDALTLMTLHLCKGLEFESVIVAGCEEGVFPISGSFFDREQLEEECRLMYVGMTRAKTHLALFLARRRTLWGETQENPPSRYLDCIPDALVERRSDELLSAFAWAGRSGMQKAWTKHPNTPADSQANFDVEFNQDTWEEQAGRMEIGTKVRHKVFGTGVIADKRGDVVDVLFESGTKKTLALSIAPLEIL